MPPALQEPCWVCTAWPQLLVSVALGERRCGVGGGGGGNPASTSFFSLFFFLGNFGLAWRSPIGCQLPWKRGWHGSTEAALALVGSRWQLPNRPQTAGARGAARAGLRRGVPWLPGCPGSWGAPSHKASSAHRVPPAPGGQGTQKGCNSPCMQSSAWPALCSLLSRCVAVRGCRKPTGHQNQLDVLLVVPILLWHDPGQGASGCPHLPGTLPSTRHCGMQTHSAFTAALGGLSAMELFPWGD